MPRRLLIVLLAAGTIGGYASGFASLSRHRGWGPCHGRSWEDRGAQGYAPPAPAFRNTTPASTPAPPPTPAAAQPVFVVVTPASPQPVYAAPGAVQPVYAAPGAVQPVYVAAPAYASPVSAVPSAPAAEPATSTGAR